MLEISHLYKKFGKFVALRDMNMKVDEGELFGFVGSNGAGKTTTMRICVGLLASDGGKVTIDGEEVLNDHKKLASLVGYVPDFFGVYSNFTCMEYLQFFASTYGLRGYDTDVMCQDLLKLVKLDHKKDTNVNGLSRGMKQRLCLARGLVHDPKILFLDEPASGLDPQSRFELKEILKNLSSYGKTIIISSHILPELDQMCSSVGIINKGHVVLQGTMDEIHRAAAMQSPILITVANDQIDDAFAVLKEFATVQKVTARGNILSVVFTGTKEEESVLLTSLVSHNVAVLNFYREDSSLESLFMDIVSGEMARKAKEA